MAGTFGQRVREVRDELELSQEQLIWRLGYFWKASFLGFDKFLEKEQNVTAVLLNYFFGLSEEWLLTGNGDKYENGNEKALREAVEIKKMCAMHDMAHAEIQKMRRSLAVLEELQHFTQIED